MKFGVTQNVHTDVHFIIRVWVCTLYSTIVYYENRHLCKCDHPCTRANKMDDKKLTREKILRRMLRSFSVFILGNDFHAHAPLHIVNWTCAFTTVNAMAWIKWIPTGRYAHYIHRNSRRLFLCQRQEFHKMLYNVAHRHTNTQYEFWISVNR